MTEQNLQPTTHADASEDLLVDRAIKFDTKIIAFKDIDLEASARNQARFLAIHPETVELYTAAMNDGAVFPRIVVYGSKPPYSALDGNHRIRSAIAVGFTAAEMIVVSSATQAQRELFTYEANAKHGLPTSLEERIAQGVYLVGLGNQAVDVASALGVPERKLWGAVAAKRSRQRLERLGAKISTRWGDDTFRRLASIRSDTVVVPFAKLITSAGLSNTEVSALIVQVNAFTTEGSQLAFIEQRAAQLAPIIRSTAGGAVNLPKEVTTLRLGLRMFKNMEPDRLAAAVATIDPGLRDSLGRETLESVSVLINLAGVFKK